jgi:hypothetical protein
MMNLKSVVVAAALTVPALLPSASGAETHRVIVLDLGPQKLRSDNHRLLVFEIESNKVLAEVQLGRGTSIAVSPAGDLVAALSVHRTGDQFEQRLNIYGIADLKLVKSGLVSTEIPRFVYQQGAAADICVSPDGEEIVIQGAERGFGNADLATTLLNCLKLELDSEGFYKRSRKTVAIPRCHGVDFLRVADWPMVHIWNGRTGLLTVVDFDTGEIRNRLALGDDPELAKLDPLQREAADDLTMMRLRGAGFVATEAGQHGYYVPRQSGDNGHPARYRKGPGFLRKIDLAALPPQVVHQGEQREDDLRPGPTAVSEAAGALFVLELERPGPNRLVASRRMKVFSTSDLKLQREIELPFEPTTDQVRLKASCDGKYLYAVDPWQPRLAVIEIATGLQLKEIDAAVGNYPHILIPLPEGKAAD